MQAGRPFKNNALKSQLKRANIDLRKPCLACGLPINSKYAAHHGWLHEKCEESSARDVKVYDSGPLVVETGKNRLKYHTSPKGRGFGYEQHLGRLTDPKAQSEYRDRCAAVLERLLGEHVAAGNEDVGMQYGVPADALVWAR
jgi:hypothetical protein